MEDTALHRLQTILDGRHGTLKDHVGGVIQKPVLIHPAQMVHCRGVEPVNRLIVAVPVGSLLLLGSIRTLTGSILTLSGSVRLVLRTIVVLSSVHLLLNIVFILVFVHKLFSVIDANLHKKYEIPAPLA